MECEHPPDMTSKTEETGNMDVVPHGIDRDRFILSPEK